MALEIFKTLLSRETPRGFDNGLLHRKMAAKQYLTHAWNMHDRYNLAWLKTKKKSRKFRCVGITYLFLFVTHCLGMVNLNRVCMFDGDQ